MNEPRHIVKSLLRVLPIIAVLAAFGGQNVFAQANPFHMTRALSVGSVDNRIEAVRTAKSGKSLVVRFAFKEPLTEVPDGVATTNPPTLAFDFDGMHNATGFLTRGYKTGEIEALDLVRNKGSVRAVFRLRKQMSYTADIESGMLVVRFSPLPKVGVATARASDLGGEGGKSQPAAAPAAPKAALERSEITGLFERSAPAPVPAAAVVPASVQKTDTAEPAVAATAASVSAAAPITPAPVEVADAAKVEVEAVVKKLDAGPAAPAPAPGPVQGPVSQAPSKVPQIVSAPIVAADKPASTKASAVPVDAGAAIKGDAAPLHSVRAVEFKKAANGAAKIVVDLSDDLAPAEIKQMTKSVTISFAQTTFAPGLVRRLVVAKGTPVQAVTGSVEGDAAKIMIELGGKWKLNSYQSGKRLTVDVLPEVAGAAVGEEKYLGEKMSLDFQNVDVRAALKVIGDFTKLNVVASDTVQGSVMLRMFDVPWDQALDIILQMRGLDMRRSGTVIWVAPRDEIAKREKEQLEAKQQMSDVEQLHTEYFALSYAKADEVAALLTSDKQRILSKRGSANADKRTNQVIVHDIPAAVEEARKVIGKIDIYMRQVQIEARIVEATDTFGRSLGARLGVNNIQPSKFLGGNLSIGGGLNTAAWRTGQVASSGNTGGNLWDSLSVNLPSVPSSSGAAPGVMSMVLFNNAATRFLNMELSAMEADGRGKIVSSPRVVTADREVALIEQGTELPYQEASSSGATSVAFRKANLSLKVEPHITPDGNIIMDVEINKDAPGAQTAGGIAINTKHVKTTVMIENGGTVVIGGIYTQDDRTDVNKIPFLGDVPVAGALFRNKTRSQTKTELLIFLTPTVLDTRAGNE